MNNRLNNQNKITFSPKIINAISLLIDALMVYVFWRVLIKSNYGMNQISSYDFKYIAIIIIALFVFYPIQLKNEYLYGKESKATNADRLIAVISFCLLCVCSAFPATVLLINGLS